MFRSSRSQALPFDESARFSAPAAFGAYRVLHQIGSGVLGPVFRTHDGRRDRLVAVKAFKLDLLPDQVARLTDALRRHAALASPHPAIAPVFEAGLEDATPFLAMTLVSGETLDVALRDQAPMSPERAVPLIRALASAIDAGWAAGIGHGALHPRDVFLTRGSNRIVVTGFGIVQALEIAGVNAPARRPYAPPERMAGAPWQRAADVYALAAIAHELLTGRRPVAGGEQDGVFAAAIPAARRVVVRRVLAHGLAESPEARFSAAYDFVAALDAAIEGEASASTASLFDVVESAADDVSLIGVRPPKPAPEKPVFAAEPAGHRHAPAGKTLVKPEKPDVPSERPAPPQSAMLGLSAPKSDSSGPSDLSEFAPEPDVALEPSPTTNALNDEFAPEPAGVAISVVPPKLSEFAPEPEATTAPRPPVGAPTLPASSASVATAASSGPVLTPVPSAPSAPVVRTAPSAPAMPVAPSAPGAQTPPADRSARADARPPAVRPPAARETKGLDAFFTFEEAPEPAAPAPLRPIAPTPLPLFAPSDAVRRRAYPWGAFASACGACLIAGVLIGYGYARYQLLPGPSTTATTVAVTEAGRRADTEVAVAPADAPTPGPATRPIPGDAAGPSAAASDAKRTTLGAGRLVVRSSPSGALVSVDGHMIGETPLTVRDLGMGVHALQVARPGFAPHVQQVALSPGAPVKTIAVTLEKGLTVPTSAVVAAARVGTLEVDSYPRGARVTIDGRPAGLTPVRVSDLPPGRYSVVVELSGYRAVTSRAVVEAGRAVNIKVSLER